MKGILSAFEGITVTGEASSCREVLDKIRVELFDIVLLDIKMPGRLGLDVIEEIIAERESLPVLMFSAYPEEQYGIAAIKSGAAGYLRKTGTPQEWIKAIRMVASGEKYISSALASRIVGYLQSEASVMPHEKLSSREYQVMHWMISGKSVSDIAEKLSISAKMVNVHQTRVFEKTKMENSVELFRYAIKHQLMDD